jgi:hypothetical protein
MINRARTMLKMFFALLSSSFLRLKNATGERRANNRALCVREEKVPKQAVYKKIAEVLIKSADMQTCWILAALSFI